MDELYCLMKMVTTKRNGLKLLLENIGSGHPKYEKWKGQFEALSHIAFEIEMMRPGIDDAVNDKFPTWID